MKTLKSIATSYKRSPIYNLIAVTGGIARATDFDNFLAMPVTVPDGIYAASTFGGMNVKAACGAFPEAPTGAHKHQARIIVAIADIERLVPAVSDEETRYYLCGIFFDHNNQRMVATTGHILKICKQEIMGDCSAIISTKTLKYAISLAKELKVKTITIDITDSTYGITIIVGAATIVAKAIDGTYPDVERVIPKQDPAARSMPWDNGNFMKHYKNIKALAKLAGDKTATVRFKASEIQAYDHLFPLGAACPLEIGFNADYLKAMESGTMVFSDAASPARIDHTDTRYTSVIMPMRV